jgi:hypothetical protein
MDGNPFGGGEGGEMTTDDCKRMMAQIAMAERNDPHKKMMKRLQEEHDEHTHTLARVVDHRRLLTEDQRRQELLGGDIVPHPSPAKVKMQQAVKKTILAAKLAKAKMKLGSTGASMFDAVRGAQAKQQLDGVSATEASSKRPLALRGALTKAKKTLVAEPPSTSPLPLVSPTRRNLPALHTAAKGGMHQETLPQLQKAKKRHQHFSVDAVSSTLGSKKESELRKKQEDKKARRATKRTELAQRWKKMRRTSLFDVEGEVAKHREEVTEEKKMMGEIKCEGEMKCRKCKTKIDITAVMEADQVS